VYIDVCIFVQTSLACKQPFDTLWRAALPFFGLMLGCLALLIWQPWIAIGLVRQCAGQAAWAAAKRWAWSRAAQ
jgi:TRAP-type C4-dicarboxylate transport system permease large subunit